jgi:hypothetical protein
MFPFHSNFDTSPPHAAALARMPLYPRPAFGRGASAFGSETSATPASATSSPTSRTTGVTSTTNSATAPSSTRALLAAVPPPVPPSSRRVSSNASPTLTKQNANGSSDTKKQKLQQHSNDTAEEDEDDNQVVVEAANVDDETAAHLREVNEAYFLAFEEASTESEEEKNSRARPVQSSGGKRKSLEAGKQRAAAVPSSTAAQSAALPATQSLAPPPPAAAQVRRAVSQQQQSAAARRTSVTNDRNRGIDTNTSSSVGSVAAAKAKNPKNNDSNVFRYSFGAPVEKNDTQEDGGVIRATRQAPESTLRSNIRSVPFGAQVESAESRKQYNDTETEDELEEEEGGGGWGEVGSKEKEEEEGGEDDDHDTEGGESEDQGDRRHSSRLGRDAASAQAATSRFKAKPRGEGHINDNTDDDGEEGMNENIYHDNDHDDDDDRDDDDRDDSGVRISSSSPRSGTVEGVTYNKRVVAAHADAAADDKYLYDDFGRRRAPAVVAAKRAEGKRKIAHEKRAAQAFEFSASGGHASAIWLIAHTFSVLVNVSIFALAIAAALAPWVIVTVASTTADESLNIQYALLKTTTIRLDTIGVTISTCE